MTFLRKLQFSISLSLSLEILNVKILINSVAKAFQKAFNDAKEFNIAVKEGKELVFAPKIEEKKESKEEAKANK